MKNNNKIYDCFCYFNEDMLLELRLETLWEYIDIFVIVESVYTISGKPKPVNFDIEKFSKYRSKIRYMLVNDYPFDLRDPWRNERYQRNYIFKGLYDANPDDWILVSDLDEIPNPDLISTYNPMRYVRGDFEQLSYTYYLNNLCTENGNTVLWHGSKITTYKNFINFFSSAESLRTYKSTGVLRALKRAFARKFLFQTIKHGGWHFTWMAGIDKIIQKLESYAHQEYNKAEYKDPKLIKEKIAAGFEIFNPKARCIPQKLDNSFPKYLVQNQDKYKEWLLPTDCK